MLLVAFSRRMCCSRVCRVRRMAGLPCASGDTPTRRPGQNALLRVARGHKGRMRAAVAHGHAKALAVALPPRRPPTRPGDAAGSAPAGRSPPPPAHRRRGRASAKDSQVGINAAVGVGVLDQHAKDHRPARPCASRPRQRVCPVASARVRTTSIVCGCTESATKKVLARLLAFCARLQTVIASAAAVASSSIDALAMSMPVSSMTMVWKLSSASRRPWAISAW